MIEEYAQKRTPLPWYEILIKMQRPFCVIALVGIVAYLALAGYDKAMEAIIVAFALLVGALFGERAALKRPGEDR